MMGPGDMGMRLMADLLRHLGPMLHRSKHAGATSVPKHKKKARNRRRNKEARAARRRNRN